MEIKEIKMRKIPTLFESNKKSFEVFYGHFNLKNLLPIIFKTKFKANIRLFEYYYYFVVIMYIL
jgi:hypothetical protein